MPDRDKVSDRWSDHHERRQAPGRDAWMYAIDHPRLRARLYDTYLGGLDPFSWLRARLPAPAPARSALEIGCGGGDLAFGLVADRFCERIDAFDIAEGAIAAAQAKARNLGLATLRFHLLDGNAWCMPPRQYDLVYASHALHHIQELEHLFTQVAATLQPGGVFFADDYIGPSRMQYSDPHLAAMNEALATLPEAKRRDRQGVVKSTIKRVPASLFLLHDPSEAVRSAEIVPVLRRLFDVEVVPMGMSLTFQVLLDIVHNFDPDDPADDALIDGLVRLEQQAERDGRAEPLFACIMARPKPALAGAAEPPGPACTDMAALLASTLAPEPDLAAIAAIEGWLFPEAIDLSTRLFHLQQASGAVTGVLELGVFKGKYLALLAGLAPAGVPVVGIDAYTSRVGEQVPPAARAFAHAEAVANVRGASGHVPEILVAFTGDVPPGTLRALSPRGYSFISVDAAHLSPNVEQDLALVEAVMDRDAITAVDDVFSPSLPGVTEGLHRHFIGHPERTLAPLAYAGNKLFLCHRDRHAHYLAYVRWLLQQPGAPAYMASTRQREADAAATGFTSTLFGYEMIAFQWT